jgi:nucleoside-diphosphate-sugar epimerase
MKTLVTGPTGLLGSHIVEALLAQGYEVRALARQTSDTSHLKITAAQIVYGDVENYDTLPPAVEGVDIVFHSASKVLWGEWQDFEKANVKGTENMLRASAEAGVSRFLHVSSATIYARTEGDETPLNEDASREISCTPYTYYSYSKLKGEEAVFEYQKQGKLNVTVIRPLFIYGPRDRSGTDHIYGYAKSRIILWPGKRQPVLAPVYASDVAELAILAATSNKAIGEAYNVAPPKPVSYREMTACMIRAQGGWRLQVNIPLRLMLPAVTIMERWAKLRGKEIHSTTRNLTRMSGENLSIDGSKARTELGWEPKVSIDEGTRRYVQWRRSQGKR